MNHQLNLQALRPAEALRIINSTSLGTVLTEQKLRRHRNRAGYRIGTDKTVNLFKYAAWLTQEYFREKPAVKDYFEKKRDQALKNLEAVRAAQDIGDIPKVVDPQRRQAALNSLRAFCEIYFKEVFYLAWSADHLRVIDKIERAVRHHALFAMAMPRASGKALALDTPIPTLVIRHEENGISSRNTLEKVRLRRIAEKMEWRPMANIEIGDVLLDERGEPVLVEFVTDFLFDRPCYEVGFDHGEPIVCDAEHLWRVYVNSFWQTLPTRSLVDGRRYLLPCVRVLHHVPQFIVTVKPVPTVPVKCIQVDSPSRLYLAGRGFVPTHNTVLCQTAVVWSAFSGATPFVCLIAASADRAQNLLETIKTWLETNPLLQQDFPEVCYPIQCLERIANRQKGQKCHGIPTRMEWLSDKIVLPTIEGSASSGIVITSSGLHGSDIRGQQHARPDGRVARPSLVLIDDPQTTESAWSPSQSIRREAILAGDVLGMAGPGKKIAGLMACTIIRPGDMASRILDREEHPEWQGEHTKLVYSFPANEKLWEQYAQLRNDSLRNDGDGSVATEFYREHRSEMDAGADVAWPERYNNDEISAIQHAMNLKIRDESAFWAEFQNEPKLEQLGEEMLSAEQIAGKTNGVPQGLVPFGSQYLTMFIDVHKDLLYWMVTAWESNFTGSIIDYGTWPDQLREYFTLADSRRTISQQTGGGLEASLYAALEQLCNERLARAYYRDDGGEMHVERCLIDANWGQSSDVIYQFCRQSRHAAILFPSHGQYLGASSLPFANHRKQKGDRVGRHWRIPGATGSRPVRHILIDTNYWKSFIHGRLGVLMGDPGCLALYGHEAAAHRLLADHLSAEYRVRVTAYGRTVDEWKERPNRPDNHWLDCLVGCAVAASVQGAELTTLKEQNTVARPRIKLSRFLRE